MSSRWSEAKLFKFLRLYKRYECLWNPYSPEYANRSIKSAAFSQILYEMNELGLTVDKCLGEIKYIRDTYKRERKRLQSLTDLGGRGYSKLLWYPLMNSMLSKIIEDEERVNAAAVGDCSALVAVTKNLSLDAGDRFDRRIVPWNRLNEDMTMCPYLSDSNHGDYSYPNNFLRPNCPCSFEGANEHIRSCPTGGFLNNSSYNCFSIDQISYRLPRTSRNHRNGISDINSAVRISESHQPSPNRGYDMPMMKSVIQEESGNQSEKSFDVVQHRALAVCNDCEKENYSDKKVKVEQESTPEVSAEKERIKKKKYHTQHQLTLRKSPKKNKRNLTEMVLDLIQNALNKPCGTKRKSEEILIAKKVTKILQAIVNEQEFKCNDNKSANKNSERKSPSGSKPLDKIICRCDQPIEESTDQINYISTDEENINLAKRPTLSCKGGSSNEFDFRTIQAIQKQEAVDIPYQKTPSQVKPQEYPDVISVESASETIDSVVTKVTDFLDETLRQNGFVIERESLIERNSSIVDWSYDEMNKKVIKNEEEWKTALKNIANKLIRDKKVKDPVRFKIKTMVLPSLNGANEGRVQLCTITRPPMQNIEPRDIQIGESKRLEGNEAGVATTSVSCQCEPFKVDKQISANFEAADNNLNRSHDHPEPVEIQGSVVENNSAINLPAVLLGMSTSTQAPESVEETSLLNKRSCCDHSCKETNDSHILFSVEKSVSKCDTKPNAALPLKTSSNCVETTTSNNFDEKETFSICGIPRNILQPCEKDLPEKTESMSLETFLNIAESDLLQITNPAMFKKLFDTLKRHMERIQYQDCCSSIEVQTESRADSGNLEMLSEENEIDECQDNTEQESLCESGFSEITKCHRPCEPLPVEFDGNNYSENYTKIITEVKNEIPQSGDTTEDVQLKVVRSEEISSERQSKYLSAEKLSNQDIPCEMRSTDCRNSPVSDLDLQSKIRERITSNLMNASNHSNEEIYCINDKVAASDSCNSDTSDKASLVVISQSPRNDEINHCYQAESEVDLDTFVCTVAAQLRELTTEAALRSQQRIQTLISNSRLESERNMQHR